MPAQRRDLSLFSPGFLHTIRLNSLGHSWSHTSKNKLTLKRIPAYVDARVNRGNSSLSQMIFDSCVSGLISCTHTANVFQNLHRRQVTPMSFRGGFAPGVASEQILQTFFFGHCSFCFCSDSDGTLRPFGLGEFQEYRGKVPCPRCFSGSRFMSCVLCFCSTVLLHFFQLLLLLSWAPFWIRDFPNVHVRGEDTKMVLL